MQIRRTIPDDLPSIRALEQQTENAAHWSAREYDALFAPDAPTRIALVAIDESDTPEVRGFVIARCASNQWEIENVVVGEKYRRLGIGTQLIREVLLQAHTSGATSVLLEVRESNFAARRLYEKLGFNEQARRKAYYKNPTEDALLLQMPAAIP